MHSGFVTQPACRRDRAVDPRPRRNSGHPPGTPDERRGVTLYEVVLSLAIFSGAMAALAQGISVGSQAAIKSQLQTQAILNCASKLSEVLSGVEPMRSVSGVPLSPDHDDWTWSLHIDAGPHLDLLVLELSVAHRDSSDAVDAEFSTSRLIRDPALLAGPAESTTGPGADSFSGQR